MNPLLTSMFGGSAGKLLNELGGIVDKVVTTDQEKMNAKKELSQVVLSNLTELYQAQRDVPVKELDGNFLQRSWRPILMLAFGFIIIYQKFLAPVAHLPSVALEDQFWNLLEIGMGGYVIGRTAEKISRDLTRNIDLSMLRKKDRTLQQD